ncbi:unnamed protein product [Closterium sp. NIES-64]|nr:unnamed protein product [Closterium sp. NIES-64]
MPGMLHVGSTSSLFIQGAGPSGMRGAGTGAYTAAEEQCEQQPTAATTLAAREEEDGRGPARTDADAAATAIPAAGSTGREQVELNEGAGTSAAEAMQRARQPAEEADDTRRATAGISDEAEHPEQPISPKSQEDAAPESVKLTKREIGKTTAALMRGEQFGMKGLEAAYGLQEAEDLPAVWHRFFEDMQSMLLNKAPPEPPASSPFKTIPELLRKALEKELASFKSCLRTFSKVSNGLCELQQQFRDGEVSHALRITTPTLQLTDPTLQEKLNQALDNKLKTFKTKAQLTLIGYKEKEKAHWEGAAEVWTARTYSRFESFLEKDLHLFETHAAPDTPTPDAHLKELAVDYMARGMARELMYHAVWIKGSRNSKARGAAKREKARAEQALREEIQANPSTDLIGLVKTLVGPLQQRVEALERRQPRSGTAVEHGKAAGKSRAQRPMHANGSAPQRAPGRAQQREHTEERGQLRSTQREQPQSTQLGRGQPVQTGQQPDPGPSLDRTAQETRDPADGTQMAPMQTAQQPNTPAQPAPQAPTQPAAPAYTFMANPAFPNMYQPYPFAPMHPSLNYGSLLSPHAHPFFFPQQAVPLQQTSALAQPALSNMSVMSATPAPPAYPFATTGPPSQQVAQGPQAQVAFGPPRGTGATLNANYGPAAVPIPMRFLW